LGKSEQELVQTLTSATYTTKHKLCVRRSHASAEVLTRVLPDQPGSTCITGAPIRLPAFAGTRRSSRAGGTRLRGDGRGLRELHSGLRLRWLRKRGDAIEKEKRDAHAGQSGDAANGGGAVHVDLPLGVMHGSALAMQALSA
jgi:hypothetical protein